MHGTVPRIATDPDDPLAQRSFWNGHFRSDFICAGQNLRWQREVLSAPECRTLAKLETAFGSAPAEEMSLDDWQRVVDTALTGVFLCSRAEGRVIRPDSSTSAKRSRWYRVIAETPMKKRVSPTGLQGAAVLLASEASDDIVGLDLIVDAGYVLP
jgi:hypothetical protein